MIKLKINRIKIISFFITQLFCLQSYFGQQSISGKIVDSKTKEPLAFVSISIDGSVNGTTTNIEGIFKIKSQNDISFISLSYVGYNPLKFFIADTTEVFIKMERKDYEFNEIKILAKENPAHRIIKLTSKNRENNNPDKISSYKCNTYNKTHYDFVSNILPNKDSILIDSISLKLRAFSEKSHLIMMESVTERSYLFPNNINENVIATKVSGFKHPNFATLATDLQPFSFYNDYFKILGKDYLNPITSGSTTKYFFNLEDTLYQGLDSVFIISFRPFLGKNFEGLQGVLYINTNGYAIQNVIAYPHDKGLIDVKIQQQYQFVDNKQWFPEQLKYELHYINYPTKKTGIKLNSRSYITDVYLNPNLKKKDFNFIAVTMDPNASSKDSVYWVNHRRDTLSIKEKTTYKIIDSIGISQNMDKKLKLMEALFSFQLPISYFNIDINKILKISNYEGVRGGIGLHTNDRFSKIFNVGGYLGYGYKDEEVKYGFDTRLLFKKNSKDYFIKYAYSYDIDEAARTQYFYSKNNYNRTILNSRMDFIEQHDLSLNFRALKYFTANVSINQSTKIPTYDYTFSKDIYSTPNNPEF